MAASSPSSSPVLGKHEVFISFRGSDVRSGFLSHLHKALIDNNVDTFVDEQLERGEEISISLLDRIENSFLSIVIFSENYAFSHWCLDELVKITECKKRNGQIVIPVFYGVEPSNVRQVSGSFGDAIAKHRRNFRNSLEIWCRALRESASLSGFVSSNFKSDSELIDKIIIHIVEKLKHLFSFHDDGLVGIDSRIENVKCLLCREDVCVVGLWGVGGIGKTTIAEKVFDQICGQFESYCFVKNVREKFERSPDFLQIELLPKLLRIESSDFGNCIMIRRRLLRKKVLIVFDDVSDFDQIKFMLGKCVDYGSGSRIIITSRDKQLLKNVGAEIYEVEKLNDCEALQLFCFHAFRQCNPRKGFRKLSKRVVEYAQGLPLVLEVLGCNLQGKSVEEWKDELEILKCTCDKKIHKILRRSYDGLSEDEKEIFLDVACFFRWEQRDSVESILNFPGSKIGISRLVDKSLISISSENCIHMHDLIQQMAKEIICAEKMLKKRSRLWNPEEIYYLLSKEKGTGAIKGISLDMSKIKDINLSPKAFDRMYNLRYLMFYDSYYNSGIFQGIILPEGLEFLSEELRYLRWHRYPLKSLPFGFCAEKLVQLHMPYSQLEQLWNGVQNLANLELVDLRYSKKLIKIPNLCRALNLKVLLLSGCTSLIKLTSSLKHLSKLFNLHLDGCFSLCHLPTNLHLTNLKFLGLSGCSKLTNFPNIACYPMQNVSFQLCELYLDGCSRLQSLPNSICNLIHLTRLWIEGCVNLCELPENVGDLEFLEELIISRSGIKALPFSINNLRQLRLLNAEECQGLTLPPMTGDFPNLQEVNLNYCGILEFPRSLCSVKSLERLFLCGNNFESIPESIKQLSMLHALLLSSCKRLRYLPDLPVSLLFLNASDCTSLESAFGLRNIKFCDFHNCINLDQKKCSQMMDHVLNVENIGKRHWLCTPGSEIPEKIMYKNRRGSCVSFSFKLQEQRNCVWLYLSGVLDPQVFESWNSKVSIRCRMHLLDEWGGCIAVRKSKFGYNNNIVIHSRHAFLHLDYLSNNFVKGSKYTFVFKFYGLMIKNSFMGQCNCDAIVECGVHPLFDHEFIDQKNGMLLS